MYRCSCRRPHQRSANERNSNARFVGESILICGRRPRERCVRPSTPQIGALHRVHAHWAVTSDIGTIVMPTGTGKTDTMIAVLLSVRCQRLLVVVPSDALRQQAADKFMTLGVLRHPHSQLLAAGAKHPVVATLLHIPKDVAEVDEVFGRAQVIVMTSQTAGRCGGCAETDRRAVSLRVLR